MKIKVLPDTVINQIAAGEVVERPSSVVRELVDNAIDAGATDVCVMLESGGHTRLKVRDNGCGMTRDEAILAFERHATSKVASIEDLTTIATLGFRGEALASIAAVAKVKLVTRSRESDVGTSVTYRGGKLSDVQGCPWSEGTEIEVEHLFFNVPARRKFLKSPRSEMAKIRTWLSQSSLARPDVRYRLIADGDEVLNLSRCDSLEARGAQVCPGDLMSVSFNEAGVSIEGRLAHPGQALADASGLIVLVNGRLVTDKIIIRAVREGYDSMLKDREYPVGYLSVTLRPEDVDVNVHPQKSEVRFRHPNQIFSVVQGAVLSAVRRLKRPMAQPASSVAVGNAAVKTEAELAPVMRAQPLSFMQPAEQPTRSLESLVREVFPESPRFQPPPAGVSAPVSTATSLPRSSASTAHVAENPVGYAQRTPSNVQEFRFSNLRYIGQLLNCYLVCELDEKFVVVDMHAAHERVNYNRIRKARAERTLSVQRLLIPEVVKLTAEQVATLLDQEDALKALAFEVKQVSVDSMEVTGVPGIISHLRCGDLLKEFAVEPVVEGWRERLEERVDHMAARIACHASVRSGDTMSRPEAYALFAQMDEAELAGACPHGRPVVAEFSREAVERWFGRDR